MKTENNFPMADMSSLYVCGGMFVALTAAMRIARYLSRNHRAMSPHVIAVSIFIVAVAVSIACVLFSAMDAGAIVFVIAVVFLNAPVFTPPAPQLSENGERVKKALEQKSASEASVEPEATKPSKRTSARLATPSTQKSWREILRTERAK